MQAIKTGSSLVGREWCKSTLTDGCAVLSEELALPETVPGGQAEYRTTLATSFLFKAYIIITEELRDTYNLLMGVFPLSVSLLVYLSVCLSVCLFVCLSVSLSV